MSQFMGPLEGAAKRLLIVQGAHLVKQLPKVPAVQPKVTKAVTKFAENQFRHLPAAHKTMPLVGDTGSSREKQDDAGGSEKERTSGGRRQEGDRAGSGKQKAEGGSHGHRAYTGSQSDAGDVGSKSDKVDSGDTAEEEESAGPSEQPARTVSIAPRTLPLESVRTAAEGVVVPKERGGEALDFATVATGDALMVEARKDILVPRERAKPPAVIGPKVSEGGEKAKQQSNWKTKVGALYVAWDVFDLIRDELAKKPDSEKEKVEEGLAVVRKEVEAQIDAQTDHVSKKKPSVKGMTDFELRLKALKYERGVIESRFKGLEHQFETQHSDLQKLGLSLEKRIEDLESTKLTAQAALASLHVKHALEKEGSSQRDALGVAIGAALDNIDALENNILVLRQELQKIQIVGKDIAETLSQVKDARRQTLDKRDKNIKQQEKSIEEWNDFKKLLKTAKKEITRFSPSSALLDRDPRLKKLYEILVDKNSATQKVFGKIIGFKPNDLLKIGLTLMISIMENYEYAHMVHDDELEKLTTSESSIEALEKLTSQDIDTNRVFEESIYVSLELLTTLTYKAFETHIVKDVLKMASPAYKADDAVVKQELEPFVQGLKDYITGGIKAGSSTLLERRKQIVSKEKVEENVENIIRKHADQELGEAFLIRPEGEFAKFQSQIENIRASISL